MAYSIQTAVSDGTLEVLDLSIKYMDKSHIFVYVDDVLVDGSTYSYVWLTDTRIQVVPAVASGSTLKVIRKTLTDEMWHEFSKGARFSTTSMDENFEQLLFLAQEYSEGIYVADFYTDIDVHLKRILNLGNPVNDGDAVNLRTLKEYLPNADLLPPLVSRIEAGEANSEQLALQGIPTGDKVIVGFDGSTLPNNAWVHFSGYSTIGDGGGGHLRFLKDSTAAADGVTVYAITGGRLVRENWLATGVNLRWAGAKGDGVTNDTDAINRALASYITVLVPFGTFMTNGGHNLQGKSLIGINRDVSIIKARGTNTGVTIFTGGQTNPSSPGTWGSGGAFRLENLGIYGNWDGTSGLTLVGNYKVGVLAANYNATLNTALVKGISTVYTFIKNCQFAYAYEHALMFYGNGYSTISDNIFTTCRGSGTWFAGDSTTPASTASSTATSTTYKDNQVTTCRGGLGGLVMKLTYGCSVRDNLFEANVYGYALYEGADCKFAGNYSELGYIAGDNIGVAPVLITPDVWGYTFDDIYNPVGNYVPNNTRSAVVIDRSGIRLKGTPGYGGVGIQFPAVQAPSADANTLDDYEEGTWTPVGNNISFTAASGKYTKIGDLATLTFSVTFPVTSDGSIAYIAGCPFVPVFDAGVALALAGGRATVDFTYKTSAGNTFLQPVNAAGTAFMTNANFSGGVLSGSITFQT